MKRFFLLLSTVSCIIVSSSSSAEVVDKASPINAGAIKIGGWLGGRIDANYKNRILVVSLDERLRPFKDPSETGGGWSGEHIGKWLHAAALTLDYTHDPALRKRIDQTVATLIADQDADGYLGTYAKDKRWGDFESAKDLVRQVLPMSPSSLFLLLTQLPKNPPPLWPPTLTRFSEAKHFLRFLPVSR